MAGRHPRFHGSKRASMVITVIMHQTLAIFVLLRRRGKKKKKTRIPDRHSIRFHFDFAFSDVPLLSLSRALLGFLPPYFFLPFHLQRPRRDLDGRNQMAAGRFRALAGSSSVYGRSDLRRWSIHCCRLVVNQERLWKHVGRRAAPCRRLRCAVSWQFPSCVRLQVFWWLISPYSNSIVSFFVI